MEIPKQRKNIYYSYIDFIRVFSICMVIILHCICDYYTNEAHAQNKSRFCLGFVNELSRTGVPLFFMISGFLLLNSNISNIKDFYKHRFKKIFIPFMIYDIFYIIFFVVINKSQFHASTVIQDFLNSGNAYHLWFIYSILFLYLMIPFIKIIIDNINFNALLIFFVITVFQTTLKPFLNILFNEKLYIYLTEDGMFGYLGYMLLGYIIGKSNVSSKIAKLIYAMGIISFIAAPLINMRCNTLRLTQFFNSGYAINHYMEAAAIFLFCKNNINKKNRCVSALSVATMDAYFIHVCILELCKIKINNTRPFIMMCLWIIITTVLSFLWGFLKIQFKKSLKLLIGKNNLTLNSVKTLESRLKNDIRL